LWTCATQLQLTVRARRLGVVLGLFVGFGPLAGDSNFDLVLPRLIIGYLLGLLAGELLRPRPQRGARRQADLTARAASDLAPGWARLAPWLTLLPVAAAPLLGWGWHPRGVSVLNTPKIACFGSATWPTLGQLVTVAVVAVCSLAIMKISLSRLVHRARLADDPEASTLDDALRRMSARTVLGAATALGLVLIGAVAEAVYRGLNSASCSPKPLEGTDVGLYSWGHLVTPWLQWAALACLTAALSIWWQTSRATA
jgi:hypothetical protein